MKSRPSRPLAVSSRVFTNLAFALALVGFVGCDEDDDVRPPVADAAVASDTTSTPDAMSPSDSAPDRAVSVDGGDGGAETAPPPPADHDMAVVRFNANGTLDTSFGSNGIARIDLGVGAGTTRDSLWSVARDATDRLVLFGSKKADGRSDVDRAVVRLTATGAVDTSFATMGVHTLNIGNLGDNARTGLVQADGKIVASGYTRQPTGAGDQAANKVVLLRLLATGAPDPAFGVSGIVNSLPFAADPVSGLFGFAEAYAVGVQSTGSYVTTGYGRATAAGATTVDMVSFRYGPTGAIDSTWGTGGAVVLDLVGENDRGRNLAVLPDDRVFIVGSGGMTSMAIDSMAVMLTPAGIRDASFGTNGVKLYDLERTDDAFFGAAVAPSGQWLAASGYRAGGGEDDDATLLLVPLAGAVGGVEFAKAVPLSETENDRFWAVTFDATNKAVAAGFVRVGSDSFMAVARYNTDGTLDSTFGTGGVARINVAVGGTDEAARSVLVQSDGKIVIAGNVESLK